VERLEERWVVPFREFRENLDWFLRNKPELVRNVCHPVEQDGQRVYVLSVVDETQLRRLLRRLLDAEEFGSAWGLRSLSKRHEAHPFRFADQEVQYEPGEAAAKIMGGNSNWRGPVWFPTTFLMIESLRKLGKAFGAAVTVPADGREGPVTLGQVAEELANRLIRLFTRDATGRRPVYGERRMFQEDPDWRNLILFHEVFHAETGEGLGASHQTGWTGLVASLIAEWRRPPGAEPEAPVAGSDGPRA
jgi:hypothetical protein